MAGRRGYKRGSFGERGVVGEKLSCQELPSSLAYTGAHTPPLQLVIRCAMASYGISVFIGED